MVIVGDAISPGTSGRSPACRHSCGLAGRHFSRAVSVATLQAVANGLMVLHPSLANEALPAGSAPPRELDELAESLTRRELEVLQMLAAGLGNKEIAARLGISEHTVKFHVASILGKLGAGSRTEAVSLGIRRGLVLL